MRRVSIRALMAVVVVSAVGLAALRNADALWAGLLLLVALAAIGIAVLGASIMRSRERCWWLGFAVFAGGYLIASLCPIGSELPTTWILDYVHSRVAVPSSQDAALSQLISLRQSRFIVNLKFDAARKASHGLPASTDPAIEQLLKSKALVDRKIDSIQLRLKRLSEPTASTSSDDATTDDGSWEQALNRWRAMFPGAVNQGHFRRTGHSLFALLAGLTGRTVGVWFYISRERQEASQRAQ
jgi:hypothetical protein